MAIARLGGNELKNDRIEKYLMFISVLLLIMIALQIPILARADDGWEPIILPEPLTVENQIVPTQYDGMWSSRK